MTAIVDDYREVYRVGAPPDHADLGEGFPLVLVEKEFDGEVFRGIVADEDTGHVIWLDPHEQALAVEFFGGHLS